MRRNLQWIESSSTWETPAVKQWNTLESSNATIKPAKNISMDISFGELSDGCIFGTFDNCDIPTYCIDFMWTKPGSGYLLTHQILFHYMIVQVKDKYVLGDLTVLSDEDRTIVCQQILFILQTLTICQLKILFPCRIIAFPGRIKFCTNPKISLNRQNSSK